MKIIYKIFKIVAILPLLVAAIITATQGITPIYNFKDTEPFSGNEVVNPYRGLDSADFASSFRKVNIHAHQSKEGIPFEDMHDYKDGEFEKLYQELGYDIALISDHQYINPRSPIKVYEHGINLANFHLNCFGVDYASSFNIPIMLIQRSQMQNIIDRMRDNGAKLISLNHPDRYYFGFDFKKLDILRGYDVIEMGDTGGGGDSPWDYVLSAGFCPMLSATDDSHFPMSDCDKMGSRYTMVALGDDLSEDNLYSTLKRGASYGVQIGVNGKRSPGTEPRFKHIDMRGDSIIIELTQEFKKVIFIGQGGVQKKVVKGRDSIAWYKMQPDDTYIRAEILLPTQQLVWLNPFARTTPSDAAPLHSVNYLLTIINTLMWSLLTLTLLGIIVRWSLGIKLRPIIKRFTKR